jgi:hypothetical protein
LPLKTDSAADPGRKHGEKVILALNIVSKQSVYRNKVTDLANEAIRGTISPEAFYQGLTQTISSLIRCSRTSLWRYTSAECNSVVCVNLYQPRTEKKLNAETAATQTPIGKTPGGFRAFATGIG